MKTLQEIQQENRICKVSNCNSCVHAKELCDKHYRRILRKGTLKVTRCLITGTLEQQKALFLERVKVGGQNDCWIWLKGKDKHGYGNSWKDGKCVQAHRLSYKLFTREIPKGLFINHKCHNPSCVNPKHLYAGTPADNSRDMVLAGRSARNAGEKHGNSILKNEQVLFIKRKLKEGMPVKKLAEEFKMKINYISSIKLGTRWKHLNEEQSEVTQIAVARLLGY